MEHTAEPNGTEREECSDVGNLDMFTSANPPQLGPTIGSERTTFELHNGAKEV